MLAEAPKVYRDARHDGDPPESKSPCPFELRLTFEKLKWVSSNLLSQDPGLVLGPLANPVLPILV